MSIAGSRSFRMPAPCECQPLVVNGTDAFHALCHEFKFSAMSIPRTYVDVMACPSHPVCLGGEQGYVCLTPVWRVT